MTFNYTRTWAKSLQERGYSKFKFSELPEDLRIYNLHRKAISQGIVRKVGYTQGVRSNQVVGIWKVTI